MGLFWAVFYGIFYRRVLLLYAKLFKNSYSKCNLAGKNVLITGAASGLGRQIAFDLLRMPKERQPRKLYLWDINPLKEFQDLGKSPNEPEIELYVGDMCDYQKVNDQIYTYSKQNVNLDIVLLNAGIAANNYLSKMKFEDYYKTIDVNFLSNVNFSKTLMEVHHPKNVLYTASLAAFVGDAKMSEYCPSKHAIRSFAHACRREYG